MIVKITQKNNHLIDNQQKRLTQYTLKHYKCVKLLLVKIYVRRHYHQNDNAREKQHILFPFFIPPVSFSNLGDRFPWRASLIKFKMYKKVFIAFMHFYLWDSTTQSIMALLLFIGHI